METEQGFPGGSARPFSPSSIDPADVARFERIGAEWWDPKGPMSKLHEINPLRLRFIRDAVARHWSGSKASADSPPLSGLRVLDIGCGGGILSEPLARLGGEVTGIDPGSGNVEVARFHAAQQQLPVTYRACTAEQMAAGNEQFDIVLAMEVVEHVMKPDRFVGTVCSLVKPGGLLIASTLNRTAKSYVLAILGAEYVLRWIPRGTHSWTQFVTPDEFTGWIHATGLKVIDTTGMIFDPLRGQWRLGRDTDVNYFITARRAA